MPFRVSAVVKVYLTTAEIFLAFHNSLLIIKPLNYGDESCDIISVGDGSFASVKQNIIDSLNSHVLEEIYLSDPSFLIGFLNFMNLLISGKVGRQFLPYIAFVDAIQKQSGIADGYTPPEPHRDCSIFFG